MTKCLLKAAGRAAALGAILVLGLLLGGCENPANSNSGPSARELAAEGFRDDYREILEKALVRITLSDEAAIDEALAAYEGLGDEVKAELAAEKAKLDSLKVRANARRASAAALYTYLDGLPENTRYSPYYIAYTGNETPAAVYNALGAAGKYVSLDLSQSGVEGFEWDAEPGRALVIDLVLPDSLEEINDCLRITPALGGFPNLKTLRSAGLLRLGAYALADCTVEEVTLDEVTEIGTYAFAGSSLKTINLPKTTTVGARIFLDCANLATVNMPELTAGGSYDFQNCTGLKEITLPKLTVTGTTFDHCTNLTRVNLPEATTINANTFTYCTSLEEITLPEATTIGRSAFNLCDGVTTITLPKAATIGDTAFLQCFKLTTVILGETPPTMGTTVFKTTASLVARTITVKVPDVGAYTAAGSPWTDKVNMTNTAAGNYWDNTASTRGNLTVALAAIDG